MIVSQLLFAVVRASTIGLIVLTTLSLVGECLRQGNVKTALVIDHSHCVGSSEHRTSPHQHRLVNPYAHRGNELTLSGASRTSSSHTSSRASHILPSGPAHPLHHHRNSPSSHNPAQVEPCQAPLMASRPQGRPSSPLSASRPQAASSPSPAPEGSPSDNGLQVGFYKGKCSNKTVDVEEIIASIVKARFGIDPTILPAILRMQFHDCFVQGCDASVLIDGNSTEKTATPNLSLRGFDLMDSIKAAVESECPGLVSCADIIAVATKVLLKLGGGPDYPVRTGRRDGVVSKAKGAGTLPSPFLSVNQTIAAFNAKNFTKDQMVILLGCHTVGIAHCRFIQGRLYPGTFNFDPLMDPNLRKQLMARCPHGINSNNSTFLDQGPGSSNLVDNSYFSQILKQRGILSIDQELARDPATQGFVLQVSLNATLFNTELANAMVKLQALDVLTGNQGQIRKVCSKVN